MLLLSGEMGLCWATTRWGEALVEFGAAIDGDAAATGCADGMNEFCVV